MRRGIILALLLGQALAIGAQDLPALPPANPLAGHQVEATLPGLVLVVTQDQVGVTWDGPLLLEVDGRPAARIALPAASTALPGARALPWWRGAALAGLGGALGALLGGFISPKAMLLGAALGAGGGASVGLVWMIGER